MPSSGTATPDHRTPPPAQRPPPPPPSVPAAAAARGGGEPAPAAASGGSAKRPPPPRGPPPPGSARPPPPQKTVVPEAVARPRTPPRTPPPPFIDRERTEAAHRAAAATEGRVGRSDSQAAAVQPSHYNNNPPPQATAAARPRAGTGPPPAAPAAAAASQEQQQQRTEGFGKTDRDGSGSGGRAERPRAATVTRPPAPRSLPLSAAASPPRAASPDGRLRLPATRPSPPAPAAPAPPAASNSGSAPAGQTAGTMTASAAPTATDTGEAAPTTEAPPLKKLAVDEPAKDANSSREHRTGNSGESGDSGGGVCAAAVVNRALELETPARADGVGPAAAAAPPVSHSRVPANGDGGNSGRAGSGGALLTVCVVVRVPPAAGVYIESAPIEEVRVNNVDPQVTSVRRLLQLVIKAINFVPAARGGLQFRLPSRDLSVSRDAIITMREDAMLADYGVASDAAAHGAQNDEPVVLTWSTGTVEEALVVAADANAEDLHHNSTEAWAASSSAQLPVTDQGLVHTPTRLRSSDPAALHPSEGYAPTATRAAAAPEQHRTGNSCVPLAFVRRTPLDTPERPDDVCAPPPPPPPPPPTMPPPLKRQYVTHLAPAGCSLTMTSRGLVTSPRRSPSPVLRGGDAIGRDDIGGGGGGGMSVHHAWKAGTPAAAAAPLMSPLRGPENGPMGRWRSDGGGIGFADNRAPVAISFGGAVRRDASPRTTVSSPSPLRLSPVGSQRARAARCSVPIEVDGEQVVPVTREEQLLADEILSIRRALAAYEGSAARSSSHPWRPS